MSWIIPGIHEDYVQHFDNGYETYQPKDIWKLRHLRPHLRLRVHIKLRELAQNLICTDFQTEPYWILWGLIKSKSNELLNKEEKFYRQHKEGVIRKGEEAEWRDLPPWQTLVKYQSFPVCFDEEIQLIRLSRVWPGSVACVVTNPTGIVENAAKGTKRGADNADLKDGATSKRRRLYQSDSEAQFGFYDDHRILETANQDIKPEAYVESADNFLGNARSPQTDAKEEAEAQMAARKAKIETDMDIDDALYIEHSRQIEYVWKIFPGKSKSAPQWEKIGAWKDWLRNAGKSIPAPSEARLQEVRMSARPTRTIAPSIATYLPVVTSSGSTAGTGLEPEVGDYEDPKDESTWYRLPGSEDRYLCGHWRDRCRERKCSPNDTNHVCCHVGLSREKKLASLRRPEYKRKHDNGRKNGRRS
jgi:hypothetical protein